jgi:hypothetical protein
MEGEKLNILSESAGWRFVYQFVNKEGIAVENTGEMHFKVMSEDHVILKWWFIDDYQQFIDLLIDIRRIGKCYYSYESNDLSGGAGTMKGTLHTDRNCLYRKLYMGATSLNGSEIIIRNGDTCTINGIIYHNDTMVKSWNGILEKINPAGQ